MPLDLLWVDDNLDLFHIFQFQTSFLWASQLKTSGLKRWDFKPFSQEIVKKIWPAASNGWELLLKHLGEAGMWINRLPLACNGVIIKNGWKVVTIPGFVLDISISYNELKSCLISIFHSHYLFLHVPMGAETQKFVCCVCQCHDMSCCVLEWCVQKCICMRTFASVQFQMCKYMTILVRIYIYVLSIYIRYIIRTYVYNIICLYIILHVYIYIYIYMMYFFVYVYVNIYGMLATWSNGFYNPKLAIVFQLATLCSTSGLLSCEYRRLPHWWVRGDPQGLR